jgi:Domain of unknown function (DUF4157)
MRQYEFEQARQTRATWKAPSTKTRVAEKQSPSAREPVSGRSELKPQASNSLMKRSDSMGQVNATASLLQLQRQQGNQYVQRLLQIARSSEGAADVMPDVERAIESSRGGGQSLDSGIQAQMGSALNADFSGVRVHTDAGADGLNESLSARAFTTGNDIYFRQGEYNPGSSSGRELLAHELTHVVQQNPDKIQTKSDDEGSQGGCTCGASPAAGPQMKFTVSQPGDQYEQEADRIANAVMHQESSASSSQAQSINRQMPEEDKEKLQGKYRDDKIARQMEEEEELRRAEMPGGQVRRQAEKDKDKLV